MSDAINKPAHYNQGSIECIDAMQQILTPEEFRGFLKGNAFKYLWREKGKNGIEDLRKGKDYYDRLIELVDESEPEQLATGEVTGEATVEVKPPEGWRWLELGEVIRRGDLPWEDGWVYATEPIMLGMALQAHWKPMIRRNKFEVGEKVVHVNGINVCEVVECDHEKNRYAITYNGSEYAYESKWLAPYIEDAK